MSAQPTPLPGDVRVTRKRTPPLYFVTAAASWPLVRLVYRTRWRGRENVPRSGGAVIACNHLSNFDPWPLGVGVFPRRHLRFMAKIELFRWPLGPILRGFGGFPIDRGAADRTALATAVQLCRDGEILMMFPEGTRRRKGLRKRFEAQAHTGAARIALRAGVPLVPAAIKGTDRLARLGPVAVTFGPPLVLDDLSALDRRSAAEAATDRLMTAIAELEVGLADGNG